MWKSNFSAMKVLRTAGKKERFDEVLICSGEDIFSTSC